LLSFKRLGRKRQIEIRIKNVTGKGEKKRGSSRSWNQKPAKSKK
jgi:hypothetical protein